MKEKVSDRIAISTSIFREKMPVDEKSLSLIAEAGIRNVEIFEDSSQYDLSNPLDAKKLRDMCSNLGLSIISYHAYEILFNGIESEPAREKLVDTCKRQLDNLQEAGGTIWADHTRIFDKPSMKCHQDLLRYVEGTKVKIVTENFVTEGAWAEDRMAYFKELPHPQLGLLLDIGHVKNKAGGRPMTLPGGPTEILTLCGEKLYHVHLHGFKNGKGHYPPLCPGDEIQWQELIPCLWDIGYNGYILFEPAQRSVLSEALDYTGRMGSNITEMLGHN